MRSWFDRPALGASSILAAVLLCGAATAPIRALAAPEQRDAPGPRCDGLELERQPLDAALLRLGQRAGVSIVFQREIAHDLVSVPLHGDFSCAEALDRLLAGTGLEHSLVGERVIVVRRRPASDLQISAVPLPAGVKRMDRPDADVMEEVHVFGRSVTGSRILNPGLDMDAQVDVIDRPELELSGLQTLSDVIRRLPAVAGNATSTQVTNGGDGTASVTLRGLPASNTLVLLNGRRMNSDALRGESVDLNTIPLAAVQQVEILKDGASAIYGSDAVAGVVNVVTRKIDGLAVSAYGGTSSRGDLDTRHLSVLWGQRREGGAFTIGAEHFDQGSIMSRDRAISRSADDRSRGGIDKRSSATVPAIAIVDGTPLTLIDGAAGTRPGDFRPATEDDRFNFRDYTTASVPSDRWSLFAEGDARLGAGITGYFESLYTDTHASNNLAPAPVFTGFEVLPLTVAADAAYNPFGKPIEDVRRRIVELPSRTMQDDTRTGRMVLGLRIRHGDAGADLYVSHDQTRARERLSNVLYGPALQTALGPATTCAGTDGCVPLNLFGPAGSISNAMLDWIGTSTLTRARSSLDTLSLNADGPLFDLPAGRVEFAIGGELRREQLNVNPDPAAANQEIISGGSYGSSSGSRQVREMYFELLVPVLTDLQGASQLDIQFADRYSSYSDFGTTNNPRVSLRWRPVHDLLLRTTLARGFRAPTLRELNLSVQQSAAFLIDPCAQAANVGVLPGCVRQADPSLTQFLTLTGGNRGLAAEQSRSLTFGFLWTPSFVPGDARLSVDFYDIEQNDVVDASAQYVVNENARNGLFADRVRRDPLGNLAQVTATNINIGRRDVSGLDISARWELPPTRYGLLTLAADAALIRSFEDQLNPDAPRVDRAGTFSDAASEGNGALPDWKMNLGATWSLGGWQARYDLQYVSAIDEEIPGTEHTRTIHAWLVHNVQLDYRWLGARRDTRLALGMNNIADTPPPFSAAAFNDSFDARTYDLVGRFLYARLSTRL